VQVVTSSLTRARQTAEEIAAMIASGKVTVEDRLVECDFGDWEGHTFAEVRQRWPGELDAWLGSTAVAPPGGESFDQVAARLLPVFGELRESYPGQDVVVVGHVTGIKLLLRDALDAGPRFLHRLHLDPAGISVVDNWADGGISVRLVNDTSHLAGIVT
jgi:probable phosphoglycerate mutase